MLSQRGQDFAAADLPNVGHGIQPYGDQLMTVGATRNHTVQREFYAKVERVLLAWLRGETRMVIRPATQEHFPLPEEVAV